MITHNLDPILIIWPVPTRNHVVVYVNADTTSLSPLSPSSSLGVDLFL